jgi:phosphoribosylformylglycinamidine synthase
VPAAAIGAAGGDGLVVEDCFTIGLAELAAAHAGTLPALFG